MNITGQCHCGAISFTALIDPNKIIVCHCSDCQSFSGSPFRAVAPAAVENVKLTGTPKLYIKTADSGNKRAQAFCGDCGTQLYATEPDTPKVLGIRLGCVNERAQIKPTIQIWGKSALPWLNALHEIPQHQTGPTSPLV
jgi:hypothetical protein